MTNINSATSSINLIKKALKSRGYTFNVFVLDESQFTKFTSPSGKIWLTADAHISYPFASTAVGSISKNKYLAYNFADLNKVNYPKTYKFTPGSNAQARHEVQGFAESHFPVFVKPGSASLSNGISRNIRDAQHLHQAIKQASEYSNYVLVQEQARGEEVRFTYLKGEIVSAIVRRTPRLIGDGKKTFQQLLEAENKSRRLITSSYVTYPILDESLISVDEADRKRILKKGEVLQLSSSTMIKTGASFTDILSDVDASYKDTAKQLALNLGAKFIVVDMMIHNYRLPKTKINYNFIEFNTAPVLQAYYSCRDGKNFDILTPLVDLIDKNINKDEK